MNLKRSPFAIQDKNARDLDNAKDYPTIADLKREQKIPHEEVKAVHRRRDLDSLGQFMRNNHLLISKITILNP